MVGKLNDMMAAAVVVDSTPKVNSSEAQSVFPNTILAKERLVISI